MFRKLVSSFSALLIAVLAFGQASPAHAWPDSTTAVSTLTSADSRYEIGAIGKTLSSNMVFAYMGAENEVQYIRSYTLSPEGSLTAPVDVARSENSSIYYQFNPAKTAWVDLQGTIHLLYTRVDMGQLIRTSKLLEVTSKDGIVWTAPVEIYSMTYRGTDDCQQGMDGCGIGQVSVTHTVAGQLGLVFSLLRSDNVKELYFSTKIPGKSWVTPAVINTSNFVPYSLDLLATSKGFIASWVNSFLGNTRLMSAFSTGLTAKTWTAAQERKNLADLTALDIIQTSSTKYALVYSEPSSSPGDVIVSMQTFDTRTNRFGSSQQVVVLPSTNYITEVRSTEYRAGQSALVFSAYSQGILGTDARYLLFRNGVATAQFVNQALSTGDNISQYVQGASMDDLGHLSIVWMHSDPSHSDIDLILSQFFRGNRSDVLLGHETSFYNVGFSQDGDVYISSFWNSTISGFVRVRSDAPTLTSDVTVAGTPKAGKSLTTKLPTIEADSAGQKWLFSYQWYSCQFRVTEVLAIPTENCALISGATASGYKVKPADKGKFLQVKLSVKSDNATQVQFSASTLAVK